MDRASWETNFINHIISWSTIDDHIKSVSSSINKASCEVWNIWLGRQAGGSCLRWTHREIQLCPSDQRGPSLQLSPPCSLLSTCHPPSNEHIQPGLALLPPCHLSLACCAGARGRARQVSHQEAVMNYRLCRHSDTHICLTGSGRTIKNGDGASQSPPTGIKQLRFAILPYSSILNVCRYNYIYLHIQLNKKSWAIIQLHFVKKKKIEYILCYVSILYVC